MRRIDIHNPTRLAILRATVALYDEYKSSPCFREIADRAGIGEKNTSMVHYYIKALVAAGYLLQREKIARGLIPTDAGRAFLQSAALREGEQ